MSAFTGDTFGTYGGALKNYTPIVDPTTDLDASCQNKVFAAVAGMTHTAPRAWVRATFNGTAAPVVVAQDAVWGNGVSVVPAYSGSTGVFTITWPATVSDEIVSGAAGYTGPTALNLRSGWANVRVAGTVFFAYVTAVSANVATLSIFSTSFALVNPGSAVDIDVFVL